MANSRRGIFHPGNFQPHCICVDIFQGGHRTTGIWDHQKNMLKITIVGTAGKPVGDGDRSILHFCFYGDRMVWTERAVRNSSFGHQAQKALALCTLLLHRPGRILVLWW